MISAKISLITQGLSEAQTLGFVSLHCSLSNNFRRATAGTPPCVAPRKEVREISEKFLSRSDARHPPSARAWPHGRHGSFEASAG